MDPFVDDGPTMMLTGNIRPSARRGRYAAVRRPQTFRVQCQSRHTHRDEAMDGGPDEQPQHGQ